MINVEYPINRKNPGGGMEYAEGGVTEQLQNGPQSRRKACKNQVTLERQGGFIWQLS